jgi:hypothetical protein
MPGRSDGGAGWLLVQQPSLGEIGLRKRYSLCSALGQTRSFSHRMFTMGSRSRISGYRSRLIPLSAGNTGRPLVGVTDFSDGQLRHAHDVAGERPSGVVTVAASGSTVRRGTLLFGSPVGYSAACVVRNLSSNCSPPTRVSPLGA